MVSKKLSFARKCIKNWRKRYWIILANKLNKPLAEINASYYKMKDDFVRPIKKNQIKQTLLKNHTFSSLSLALSFKSFKTLSFKPNYIKSAKYDGHCWNEMRFTKSVS